MILIGVGGKARAGKDTIARYLVSEHKFNQGAFAFRLKKATQVKFALSDEETSKANYDKIIDRWGMSWRQLLQIEGTEAGWQVYDPLMNAGPSLWVRHIDFLWQALNAPHNVDLGYKGLVLSDMRFQHEYEWLKANGGLAWKVERPGADGAVGIKGHASEAWDFEADRVLVNDGKIPDLFSRVETAFQSAVDRSAAN